ncbi:hypothetical protein B0H12DRAFT_1100928 [Mycena haematopus]|nr:hypothetical protein B0H12DRAFT_1100928 [Mycena haematopus]
MATSLVAVFGLSTLKPRNTSRRARYTCVKHRARIYTGSNATYYHRGLSFLWSESRFASANDVYSARLSRDNIESLAYSIPDLPRFAPTCTSGKQRRSWISSLRRLWILEPFWNAQYACGTNFDEEPNHKRLRDHLRLLVPLLCDPSEQTWIDSWF